MFFRARRALHRSLFDLGCRSVLRTAPLHTQDDAITLVSMVCHGESLMYLLAVKSFCRQLGRIPQIVALNDGSLTSADLALIRHHLPQVQIPTVAEIPTETCPSGNCWERLLLISGLTEQSYVVQLDCDTLTIGPIPEVLAAIAANQSFTLLGDRSFPEIEPMRTAHSRLKESTSAQVQAVCERAFDQLPECDELLYLRGNAGFTGFAKGSLNTTRITWFSDLMRRIAADRWDQWGSEQVTSNLLIANTAGALALPVPRYLSYWAHPEIAYEQSSFLHFIGPHRYDHGFYLRLARRLIATL